MKILQISDLHFGPLHWNGDDRALIGKINSYQADLVINTGDSTSNGLEREYLQARNFLAGIKCKNLVSIIGNHDKRSKSSVGLFKKYIYNPEVVYPDHDNKSFQKKHLFLDSKVSTEEKFTDINFLKSIELHRKKVLIIGIDSNILYSDDGYVEESIVSSLTAKIGTDTYDLKLLVIHHSILATDQCPLLNSQRVIDFVNAVRIDYVFCGHTHELDFRKSEDIYHQHRFFQFMCGTTASNDLGRYGKNTLLLYEFQATKINKIYLIKIFFEDDKKRLIFEEEEILI